MHDEVRRRRNLLAVDAGFTELGVYREVITRVKEREAR